jgi:indole-3-glycerol phosphate synthase
VAIPVLRKDFTVDARDIADARAMGADAVLLIVAALDDAELSDFGALAAELGLDVLLEVHNEAELDRGMAATSAAVVGVNQRDLVTFEVDHDRAVRVGKAMPEGVVRVAESGIRGPDDAVALGEAGFHAVLVGESVVTSGDRAAAVAGLRAPRK